MAHNPHVREPLNGPIEPHVKAQLCDCTAHTPDTLVFFITSSIFLFSDCISFLKTLEISRLDHALNYLFPILPGPRASPVATVERAKAQSLGEKMTKAKSFQASGHFQFPLTTRYVANLLLIGQKVEKNCTY